MGTRISAQFLCLDGRVSGQSSERLLPVTVTLSAFRGTTLGLFPAGSPGEAEKTASSCGRRVFIELESFVWQPLFFLTEDGPESAGCWPFSVCPHPALLQVQITPRAESYWGLLNVVRRLRGGSQKGTRCRARWGGV